MTGWDIQGKTVFVAGHNGMVGRALVRRLEREPVTILTASRRQLDLTDPAAVEGWMAANRPGIVIIAAAKVGGILANRTYPVDFLEDNLLIQTNLMRASHRHGVDRLLFLGSSCIYPRDCPQPIREEYLLTGPLEPTNDAYALAKIAGLRLVRAYREQNGRHWIAAMPTNLYGPFDNFDPETSHVLPALIRRFHEAALLDAAAAAAAQVGQGPIGAAAHARVTIWGTGKPRREFLHVDDLADACLHLLRHYDDAIAINVGTGQDLTIAELASIIATATGYTGAVAFDPTRPDGTPRKLLDTSRLTANGWQPRITLEVGIADTCAWYRANHKDFNRNGRHAA
jgi:GDP-L-fucose synthase